MIKSPAYQPHHLIYIIFAGMVVREKRNLVYALNVAILCAQRQPDHVLKTHSVCNPSLDLSCVFSISCLHLKFMYSVRGKGMGVLMCSRDDGRDLAQLMDETKDMRGVAAEIGLKGEG